MKASDTPKYRKPLHYGWIIVFTGVAILFFGADLITGPAPAGLLADVTGSFSAVFWFCAGLTALAAVLSLFLKSPAAESPLKQPLS